MAGFRATTVVQLDGARIAVQVDVGFGDAITPAPEEQIWKGPLDFPEARLLAYPPETVIAEKLQAAVDLQSGNSRMKDFFDLDWLQAHREFDFATLQGAVLTTFQRRGADLSTEIPLALTPEFSGDAMKQTQWGAFLRKNKLESDSLAEVVMRIRRFLTPVIEDRVATVGRIWRPGTGWIQGETSAQ